MTEVRKLYFVFAYPVSAVTANDSLRPANARYFAILGIDLRIGFVCKRFDFIDVTWVNKHPIH
jgi:hypothetical protein